MNREELNKAYRDFFHESPAGQEFMKELDSRISDAHKTAENDPEKARDYTQHAKGIRTIVDYITGITTEINRGRQSK